MAYLDQYLFTVPESTAVMLRRKPSNPLPTQESLVWMSVEGYFDIVTEPVAPGLWTPRVVSQEIHVLVNEGAGLVWVGNWVAPQKPFRLRDSWMRDRFIEGLVSFGNPNLVTVEIEP